MKRFLCRAAPVQRGGWGFLRTRASRTSVPLCRFNPHNVHDVYRPMSSSSYPEGESRWEDMFPPEEYNDPWDDKDETLRPLDYPPLDNSTRYVIQLLRDLHHGILGHDRPSTERCNRALELLSDPRNGGNRLEGRAKRADAILQGMELFYNYPNDRLPFSLPHPDFETYFSVLKLYAKEKGMSADEGPWRCQAIVERMQQRYNELGDVQVRPDSRTWNQVVSAWANCSDDEKALQAAKLLKQLETDGLEDASSYSHTLRACASSTTNERSKTLATEVALRVWKDFQQTEFSANSYMYTFLLGALGHIDDGERRDEQVEIAFLQCCQDGMVNAHVLHEFKGVASPHLYKSLMGVISEQENTDPVTLLMQVPAEWTRNGAAKTTWGW